MNAELQKRAFGQANAICKTASNYYPDHIISNIIVRFQIEGNKEKLSLLPQQNSTVSNLAQALPPFTNTILSPALLETNSAEVQAHLERISDFLLRGKGVWWERLPNKGIKFLDSITEANFHKEGPDLHHFRSSNLTKEVDYLEECWINCVDKGIELPLSTIRKYTETGDFLTLDYSTQVEESFEPVEIVPEDQTDSTQNPDTSPEIVQDCAAQTPGLFSGVKCAQYGLIARVQSVSPTHYTVNVILNQLTPYHKCRPCSQGVLWMLSVTLTY